MLALDRARRQFSDPASECRLTCSGYGGPGHLEREVGPMGRVFARTPNVAVGSDTRPEHNRDARSGRTLRLRDRICMPAFPPIPAVGPSAALHLRRSQFARRSTALDPLSTFKIGPANGREARESGLRLKAWVAEAILSELGIQLPPGSAPVLAPEQNALVFDGLSRLCSFERRSSFAALREKSDARRRGWPKTDAFLVDPRR